MAGYGNALGRRFMQVYGFLALQALLFFWAAGGIAYPRAWLFFGICLLNLAVNSVLMLRRAPELIARRGSIQPGTKGWDLAFSAAYAFSCLAMPALAGMELGQFHSESLGLPYAAAGVVLYAFGASIITWAMLENRFFATTVAIQEGQKVASGGPYAIVRHPGYAGMMLTALAQPLILGSALALAMSAIILVLFLARTALEDRTLREELPGYEGYAEKTGYRLVPGLW